METVTILHIVPIYAALLGLIFVPITLRVGLYRVKNKIDIGDGDDAALLRDGRRIGGCTYFALSWPVGYCSVRLSPHWHDGYTSYLSGSRLLAAEQETLAAFG